MATLINNKSALRYAELGCKSYFSFLQGASSPEQLVQRAYRLGLDALAITDINGVYGSVRAFKAAQAYPIKLITGCTIALSDQCSFIILVQSHTGYTNMCKLLSHLHTAPAPLSPTQLFDLLHSHQQDLIVIIPVHQPDPIANTLQSIVRNRCFLGVSRHYLQHHTPFAHQTSLPLVAFNDVYYHDSSQRKLQDVLTCIRHHTPLPQAHSLLFTNHERHLKSAHQMHQLFNDIPEALDNTISIAQSCTFTLSELSYQYPSEFIPDHFTAHEYLSQLTWQGAMKNYSNNIPHAVQRQISHELALIKKLNFEHYFLTVWDIVCFARSQNILCQGRGSAANSTVCFVLGITAIDPVRQGLLFERFISLERGEPPDIDIDFEHERREEVIQYIYSKYGRHRAAMVAQVTTYQMRSALCEVSKAFGMSHREAIALTRQYIKDQPSSLTNWIKKNHHTIDQDRLTHIVSIAQSIIGFPRHIGTHVGGFILTHHNLANIVPIQKGGRTHRTIIQWDKDDLDTLNLMKVDILGLGILTAIRKCLEYIGQPDLTMERLPAEDPNVYHMLQKADVVGVFQVESRAQMNMLPRLKPKNFFDLVIEVAIIRPGPIQGGMIHPYLRRRHGLEKTHYSHPRLVDILGKTHGVPIFQEQVMKMAVAIAGFSPGEADQLRRAMGIWKTRDSAPFAALKDKLIQGMHRHGISDRDAEDIFQQISGFGEFGFPESHSASFALLVYASAYLKCYFPVHYACALLNCQPMGFYSIHSIVDDLKRHGYDILPVDVQTSNWNSSIENGQLRLGLHLVRGLRQTIGQNIVSQRQNQPFSNISDFFVRCQPNRQEGLCLALANAFQPFNLNRRQALWSVALLQNNNTASLTDHLDYESMPEFQSLLPFEQISLDYFTIGASTGPHPLELLRSQFLSSGCLSATQLSHCSPGEYVSAAGMVIIRQKPITAKGMVFITMEDETGFINLVLTPQLYHSYRNILDAPFLWASGLVQNNQTAISILIKSMRPLSTVTKHIGNTIGNTKP